MAIKSLIIGVSKHNNPNLADLIECRYDIDNISNALIYGLNVDDNNIEKIGEEGYVPVHTVVSKLEYIKSNIDREDTLIFYFSGHGGFDENGHLLCFSDKAIITNKLVDYIDFIDCKNKLIILDTCYSGKFSIKEYPILSEKLKLKDYISNGTAVLASSSANEPSYTHPDKKLKSSLFTYFLCDALRNDIILKEGKKSLEDIKKLVSIYMNNWKRNNIKYIQDVVFRSNISGTIYFDVQKYKAYNPNKFYYDNHLYTIYDVEDVHISNKKRYRVNVILKNDYDLITISKIHKDIISKTKSIDVYSSKKKELRYKGQKSNIIFIFYGYDEEDMISSNFKYKSIYVDENQDKNWWYKKTSNSQFINDVYIETFTMYEKIKKFREENTEQTFELYNDSRLIINKLINFSEFVRGKFYEYENKIIDENEFRISINNESASIKSLYNDLTDLSFPEKDLDDWINICIGLGSTIHNFILFYSEIGLKTWNNPDIRKQLMRNNIDKYLEDLKRLEIEESKLMENNIVN